jgi:hypothetical protein
MKSGRVSRHLAVFLVSFAVLADEVALTRLFSVVLQYHFVFLAISVAICGNGLGGLVRQFAKSTSENTTVILSEAKDPTLRVGSFGLRPQDDSGFRTRSKRSSFDALVLGASGFALANAGCVVLLVRWVFPYEIDHVWMAGAILLVPFTFAGVFFAELFSRSPEGAGGLYAADLLGAGLAAVAVIAMVQISGAVGAALLASALAGLGGAFAARSGPGRWAALAATLTPLLVWAGDVSTSFLDVDRVAVGARVADAGLVTSLFLDLSRPPAERPILLTTEWNAFARTDVVEHPAFGSLRKSSYPVYTNGNVPTNMLRVETDLRRGDAKLAAAALAAKGVFPPVSDFAFGLGAIPRVLSIGPGGGMDVLLALLHGAQEIEGAELNPSILDIMRRYGDFNGHLYERPDVHVVTAEGRSYVRQSKEDFDLIYAALTQTVTASGATSLMESYVFTVEGFRDYFSHLTPTGYLAVVTHERALAARLLGTAVKMLTLDGESEAEALRHLLLLDGGRPPYRFLLVLEKQPIARAESDEIAASARARELTVVHRPWTRDGMFASVERGDSTVGEILEGIEAKNPGFSIQPTTDDRPFFYDTQRGIPSALLGLLAGAAVLILAFSISFLAVRGGRAARQLAPFVVYFAALGVGFLVIEIALIQKLVLVLGHPTLALTVTLFSLLVGAGIGSGLSQRVANERAAGVAARAAIVAALLVAALAWFFGSPLSGSLLGWALGARVASAVLVLGILGSLLGRLFPLGVRRLSQVSSTDIPWMWGVNGLFSVVGSLAAAALAKLVGFQSVLLLGASIYLLLGVAVWVFRGETS